jgi:hypothetical protein
MKTTFLICLTTLTCFVADAQNDSTKFLRGRFFVGGVDGGHTFRIEAREMNASGETNFENSENHSLTTSLGYGFYYGTNKALTFELSQSVQFSDYIRSKYWYNTYGIAVGKMKLKNVHQNKWFVLSNQRLGYNYGLSRVYVKPGFPEFTPSPPNDYSHGLFYGVAVGALYKPNNSFVYRLTIPLFNIGISRSKNYYDSQNNYDEVTKYYYNTSFFYTFSNIQLSVLWSPNFIQSKKNK